MTAGAPRARPELRAALACAWPAMVVAALVLLPFLNTPFTIDDPLYLREAQHVLIDPLHPQAFDIVWSTDLNLRASQILPGGIAVPYLLAPTALAGCAEWAGHLTQLLLLFAALAATALTALRLGLDRRRAGCAALLTACCPAVLGMAGTVMPDVPAMLFVILGMERLVAWREDRKWGQALLATCWLTLAALTRTHTIVILAAAAVLLLDGIAAREIRASFRSFPFRYLPILLAPLVFFAVSAITADPEPAGENILTVMLGMPNSRHLLIENGCAFLAHWLLVIPLTIPWLALRFRRIPATGLAMTLLGASILSLRLGWVAFAAVATLLVLADVLRDAIERRDRVQLALWLWLLLAVPIVIYIQLPSKYLLPSVPAAALLVVRLLPEARSRIVRWLVPSVAAAGVILGVLILLGTRDLARTQRLAVADMVEPHVRRGDHVWFAGHWGFQWYAELAGATPVTLAPPFPESGDIIVVSEIDSPFFAREWPGAHRVLEHLTYPGSGAGRVMDAGAGAGFFSSRYGYLPWTWGRGDASRFEVWEVQ